MAQFGKSPEQPEGLSLSRIASKMQVLELGSLLAWLVLPSAFLALPSHFDLESSVARFPAPPQG